MSGGARRASLLYEGLALPEREKTCHVRGCHSPNKRGVVSATRYTDIPTSPQVLPQPRRLTRAGGLDVRVRGQVTEAVGEMPS